MPNLIDTVVGFFSPDSGLRRYRSRQLLKRAYEGANKSDGWNPRRPGASANADHRADASELRKRARSLVQNSPYVARGIASLVSYTVGTGITPRSLASNSKQIDALHAQWTKECDADGRSDLYGLQAIAVRALKADGEVIIRLRPRFATDGLVVPLQIQVLEIDWLDSGKTGSPGPRSSDTIINGIQYDQLGRITGYWLWNQHPGEQLALFRARTTSAFVPAANIIHVFSQERPGQGRGFTCLAPVISRVRDLQLYEDAELQRKNLETRLSVLATGDAAALSQEQDTALGSQTKMGELGALSSGSIIQMPTGVNLTVVEPKAAPGYVDYIKYQLHLIAAGMGVTYQMLTGDVAEGSFSSERAARINFKAAVEQDQWLNIIPRLCERLWVAFIDAAFLAGKIPAPAYGVDWSTPKWDYVNPEQDVKADLAEISGGLTSISEKLRQRGYKPELVFAEIKQDFDRLRADGTLDVMLQLQTHQAPQQAKPAKNAASATGQRADESDIDPHALKDLHQQVLSATQRALDQVQADNRSLQNTLATLMARSGPTEPMQIHNHNHIPATPVELRTEAAPAPVINLTNQVNPTPVEIRNEVSSAAPVVHNHLPSTPLAVTVNASMPTRVTEDKLIRDAKGVLTGKVTVEKDL